MSYELAFLPEAKREWDNIDTGIQRQFKKKLEKVLENPHIPASRLRGFDNAYKIKQRNSGFRLVYEVYDDEILVLVIAVGKRENNTIYQKAQERSTK